MQPRVLQHEVVGAGDPLVLVPGILTGWLSWIPHTERLARSRKVIRVQPIHSELAVRGELPEPGFDWRTEREAFRLTLDALGIERADLAGWSGGGRALVEFCAAYPERVRTLTLIEPAAYWVAEQAGGGSEEPRYDESFSQKIAGRPVTEEELLEFLVQAGMVSDDYTSDPRWPVWLQNRNALASDQALAWPDRRLEDLRGLDRPVLLVVGEQTTDWLKRVISILGESYPRSRTIRLAGDHACHIQSIDRFLEELEKHLAAG